MPKHHDQERGREPGRDVSQADQKQQGHDCQGCRGSVGLTQVPHDVARSKDLVVMVAGHANQLAELTENDQDRDTGDVPDEDRLREVVGDPAQP